MFIPWLRTDESFSCRECSNKKKKRTERQQLVAAMRLGGGGGIAGQHGLERLGEEAGHLAAKHW
jgi:hypothetical protein